MERSWQLCLFLIGRHLWSQSKLLLDTNLWAEFNDRCWPPGFYHPLYRMIHTFTPRATVNNNTKLCESTYTTVRQGEIYRNAHVIFSLVMLTKGNACRWWPNHRFSIPRHSQCNFLFYLVRRIEEEKIRFRIFISFPFKQYCFRKSH